ncbi:hypothetical protein NDU88_005104 [Pleurodeles waltl]|uniref:Uncharacterized protein n=1 Tax=Pleurodeles waltl TaxID=8319 RepID=A0AAV7NQG6_PLEWA|nr:hypothetical protein NDU88_005104 [Pleurodeles waltl]
MASSGPGRPKPRVAPPGSQPPWLCTFAANSRRQHPLGAVACRALTGSPFCLRLRGRSARPEPWASTPADSERSPGLRGACPSALPDLLTPPSWPFLQLAEGAARVKRSSRQPPTIQQLSCRPTSGINQRRIRDSGETLGGLRELSSGEDERARWRRPGDAAGDPEILR